MLTITALMLIITAVTSTVIVYKTDIDHKVIVTHSYIIEYERRIVYKECTFRVPCHYLEIFKTRIPQRYIQCGIGKYYHGTLDYQAHLLTRYELKDPVRHFIAEVFNISLDKAHNYSRVLITDKNISTILIPMSYSNYEMYRIKCVPSLIINGTIIPCETSLYHSLIKKDNYYYPVYDLADITCMIPISTPLKSSYFTHKESGVVRLTLNNYFVQSKEGYILATSKIQPESFGLSLLVVRKQSLEEICESGKICVFNNVTLYHIIYEIKLDDVGYITEYYKWFNLRHMGEIGAVERYKELMYDNMIMINESYHSIIDIDVPISDNVNYIVIITLSSTILLLIVVIVGCTICRLRDLSKTEDIREDGDNIPRNSIYNPVTTNKETKMTEMREASEFEPMTSYRETDL